MKEISFHLSDEQSDVLNYISKMCKKDTSDFVKEALICLLPMNEYIEFKHQLIDLNNNKNQQMTDYMSNTMQTMNTSTSQRLKRIGLI